MVFKNETFIVLIVLAAIVQILCVFFIRHLNKYLQNKFSTQVANHLQNYIRGASAGLISILIVSVIVCVFTDLNRERVMYFTLCMEFLLLAVFVGGYFSIKRNMARNNGVYNLKNTILKTHILRGSLVLLFCVGLYFVLSKFFNSEIAFICAFFPYLLYKVWAGHDR